MTEKTIHLNQNVSLIKGDIFADPLQTLTIAVNTVGIMGKGQALKAKQLFPNLYIRYREACKKGQLNVGDPVIVNLSDKDDDHLFLLFPTKEHWRENSKLEYIQTGMHWLLDNYKSSGIRSLAMPALGCGLGNLSWSEVGPILCSYADKMNIPICIYLPNEEAISEEQLRPEFLLREIT